MKVDKNVLLARVIVLTNVDVRVKEAKLAVVNLKRDENLELKPDRKLEKKFGDVELYVVVYVVTNELDGIGVLVTVVVITTVGAIVVKILVIRVLETTVVMTDPSVFPPPPSPPPDDTAVAVAPNPTLMISGGPTAVAVGSAHELAAEESIQFPKLKALYP